MKMAYFLLIAVFSIAFALVSQLKTVQGDNTSGTTISNNGAVLIINQTVDKLQYNIGEPVVVHPEMSNVGGNTVFVANGLPLFHIEVRSQNGTKIFDSGYSGMLIVGWGFTLNPGATESDNGTWGSYPKAGAPAIRIDTPGKYEVLSESNVSLYGTSHEFYYKSLPNPSLSLWSKPLEITVLPEKYVPPNLPHISSPNQTAVIVIENGTSFSQCKARPCLNPDKLAVRVGTKVTWYNRDRYGHTVTSGMSNDTTAGLEFDSGVISQGESFNQTFSRQGNFSYFDEVRPWIIGKIIVTNRSSAASMTNCEDKISHQTSLILRSVDKQKAIQLATGDPAFQGLLGSSRYTAGELRVGSEGTDYASCRLVNPNIQIQFNVLDKNQNLGDCPYVIVIEDQNASKVLAVDLGSCSALSIPHQDPIEASQTFVVIAITGAVGAIAAGLSAFVMMKKK